MSVTMEEAIGAVKEMLDSREINYSEDAPTKTMYIFSANFGLTDSKLLNKVKVLISVIASKKNPELCNRIMSYAAVGLEANEDNLAAVGEYLHRANYGLAFGNFELDYDDGKIKYKMAANCVDSLPGFDAIEDMIYLPISMFERYGDGLLAVNMGIASPKNAIAKIED